MRSLVLRQPAATNSSTTGGSAQRSEWTNLFQDAPKDQFPDIKTALQSKQQSQSDSEDDGPSEDKVESEDSPLEAAKKGKNTRRRLVTSCS